LVVLDRGEEFGFWDSFLGRVGDMDGAWAEEVGFAPGALEGGDVGGVSDDGGFKAFDGVEVDGGYGKDALGVDETGGELLDLALTGSAVVDEAEEDFGLGVIGDDVGGATALDSADVERAFAEDGVGFPGGLVEAVEGGEEFEDGRVAEFGIGGVGHASGGGEGVAESAFGSESDSVGGGFAVDEEAGASRGLCGGEGAGAIAFFADDEEEGEVPDALIEEGFGGLDHGGDDAFDVASAAAPDVVVIFR
jgi:hypothetical protein